MRKVASRSTSHFLSESITGQCGLYRIQMPANSNTGGQSASAGPQKRKADSQTPSRGGDNKPQRHATFAAIKAARNIPSQRPESALKDGELDLQAFVAAHEFEIRSLEQSMATSKAAGTSRAFQQVPRGLRRRTAAHNAKRVPKRLRARALKEMKEDNTPVVEARKRKPRTTRARIRAETAKRLGVLAARQRRKRLKRAEAAGKGSEQLKEDIATGAASRKSRPKIRRNALNDPPPPPAKFRKRQLNKTWLPTHAWHAKRARMTDPIDPLWRFAMPLTPNEKIYRPTHRAQGNRGALVWDTSYMSTIGLFGNPVGIARVLRRIGVSDEMCSGDQGRRWRGGHRSWNGILVRVTGDDRRQMGPATVFWNPLAETHQSASDSKKEKREVFLRVHPSAFLEVFNELLKLAKMETPQLYIEDLRYEVGSIELSGPASTEILSSILTPYTTKDIPKSRHAKLFQSLNGLTNPSALPSNAMLGFSIQDPRLRHPPRRPTLNESEDREMELLETIASWPAEKGLEPYGLFDRNARHTASLLPSQKLINRRRSKINPGAFLKPSSVDPPIPIILLATRSGPSTRTQGSWTILAPWACILPLWYSTVHCPLTSGGNPRFAGLSETQQIAFERGLPWFPADLPATNAGIDWELEERRKRMKTWARRPKSKRVAWKNLDLGAGRKGEVGDGFACDWEYLLGLPKGRDHEDDLFDNSKEVMALNIKDTKTQVEPLQQLRQIDKAAFDGLSTTIEEAPQKSLLAVRVTLLSRGTVGPCARIYRLPEVPAPQPASSNAEVPATIPPEGASSTGLPRDLRQQWLSRIPTKTKAPKIADSQKASKDADLESRKRLLAQELTSAPLVWPPQKPNSSSINGVHPLVPNSEDLVGFVTSGSFDLSQGRGMAIGSLSVEKIIDDVRQDAKEGRLCIVRNAGENVGWIARWEAI